MHPLQPPTLEQTRDELGRLESERRAEQRYSFGIWIDDELAGMASLSNIVRGPLQSANLGVWLDRDLRGRGYGRDVIRRSTSIAFEELGLHRVEAGTLPTNKASLRAFEAVGFETIGVASAYLFVNGTWRDHVLMQKICPGAGPAA